MKIYFSAAISAGRQLVDTYRQQISHLKKFGTVLTEHIGDTEYLKCGFADPKVVFSTDRQWLNSCDIVVADVTVVSTGVGYELGVAELLQKPTFCLYDCTKTQKISAMIEGNPYFKCIAYTNILEMQDIIDKIMLSIMQN